MTGAPPSIVSVMTAFASAVPAIVGVVVPIVAVFAGVTMTGARGAIESTVKLLLVEFADVPPALEAGAYAACVPCDSGVPGVKL